MYINSSIQEHLQARKWSKYVIAGLLNSFHDLNLTPRWTVPFPFVVGFRSFILLMKVRHWFHFVGPVWRFKVLASRLNPKEIKMFAPTKERTSRMLPQISTSIHQTRHPVPREVVLKLVQNHSSHGRSGDDTTATITNIRNLFSPATQNVKKILST